MYNLKYWVRYEIKFKNNNKRIKNIIIGSSKKLRYLPAIIYFDLLIEKKHNMEVFAGTSFAFNERTKVLVGSSTRKIDQNTSQGLFRSILGSTGFGFIYDFNQILVQYGFYYYGVGVRVDGLNIGIRF